MDVSSSVKVLPDLEYDTTIEYEMNARKIIESLRIGIEEHNFDLIDQILKNLKKSDSKLILFVYERESKLFEKLFFTLNNEDHFIDLLTILVELKNVVVSSDLVAFNNMILYLINNRNEELVTKCLSLLYITLDSCVDYMKVFYEANGVSHILDILSKYNKNNDEIFYRVFDLLPLFFDVRFNSGFDFKLQILGFLIQNYATRKYTNNVIILCIFKLLDNDIDWIKNKDIINMKILGYLENVLREFVINYGTSAILTEDFLTLVKCLGVITDKSPLTNEISQNLINLLIELVKKLNDKELNSEIFTVFTNIVIKLGPRGITMLSTSKLLSLIETYEYNNNFCHFHLKMLMIDLLFSMLRFCASSQLIAFFRMEFPILLIIENLAHLSGDKAEIISSLFVNVVTSNPGNADIYKNFFLENLDTLKQVLEYSDNTISSLQKLIEIIENK